MPDSAKPLGLMGIRMIWFGEGRFLVRTLALEQSLKVAIFKLFWGWPTDPPRSRFKDNRAQRFSFAIRVPSADGSASMRLRARAFAGCTFSGADVHGVIEPEMVVLAAGLYASRAQYTCNRPPNYP